MSYLETGNISVARILVHLDMREGFVEAYNLHYKDIMRCQMLDYEGVIFRCRCCHEVRHLYKERPLINVATTEPTKILVHVRTQIVGNGEEVKAQVTTRVEPPTRTISGISSAHLAHSDAKECNVQSVEEENTPIPGTPLTTSLALNSNELYRIPCKFYCYF